MKKIAKVSRGYRLNPSTHQLIAEIQKITEGDSNTVLTKACRLYMKHLKSVNRRNNIIKTLNNYLNETAQN